MAKISHYQLRSKSRNFRKTPSKRSRARFLGRKMFNKCCGLYFLNTQLLGISVPFHRNFEEVNLRFYVKKWENQQWKRGVVFIKKIVPKKALSFIANTFLQRTLRNIANETSDFGKYRRNNCRIFLG